MVFLKTVICHSSAIAALQLYSFWKKRCRYLQQPAILDLASKPCKTTAAGTSLRRLTVDGSTSPPASSGWPSARITRWPGLPLLESRFFLWVRKPTEKFEYRQKITHRNRMIEKSTFSVGSPSETIFLWVSHAQKNYVRSD